MILTADLKRLLAQVLAVVTALAVLAGLALAGRVTLYSLSGAKTAQALHEVPEVPEGAPYRATWLPDRWTRPRRLEPSTRRLVQAAYLQAWEAVGHYQETGEVAMVTRWFAGPARTQALAFPPVMRRESWGVHHSLALTFYALDGATLALRDEGAVVVRSGLDDDSGLAGGTETVTTAIEDYDAVLTLEDGYWRVRQLRRLASAPEQTVSLAPANDSATDDGPRTTLVLPAAEDGTRRVPPLRGVALAVAWRDAVPPSVDAPDGAPVSFDRGRAGGDLDTVAALGLDTVRIDVPEDVFGIVPRAVDLAAVRVVLDLVAERGLRAELTLDDGGTDRGPGTWAEGGLRLTRIVSTLRDHPAVTLWNVHQDPERSVTPDVQLRAWLVGACRLVRSLDPRVPVTIGWRSASRAADPGTAAVTDVVTVPWQGPAERLPGWLSALRRATDGKPVLLVPVSDSWNGVWPSGRTEAEQARWTASVVRAAHAAGVAGVVAPVLRDRDGGGTVSGPGAGGRASLLPWVRGPEGHRGVVRSGGAVKPAARALLADRSAGRFTTGPLEPVRKPFTWLVVLVVVLAVLGRIRARRTRAAERPSPRPGQRRS
ncbi:MAG: hypothetical protein QG622_915 [Actinomycetota bacterium]|nr:hypothetical protein [Actinomycetota bacterium]